MNKKGTVLVVDDKPINRKPCLENLEDEGYEVFEAENGQECLELVERVNPHVILLDIMMPVMDGYTALKALKSNEATKDIPVIMLTATAEMDKRLKAFALGANDFIVKPMNVEEMIARTENYVRLKQSEDELRAFKARVSQELTTGRSVQRSITPDEALLQELTQWGITVATFSRSASEVNGDMYFVKKGEHSVLIILTDCEGHGISAAMYTMLLHAFINTCPFIESSSFARNLFVYLDQKLRSAIPNCKMVPLVSIYWDQESNEISICRGGMPFPLLVSNGDIREVKTKGAPLAVGKKLQNFEEKRFTLHSKDKLILYTDGLTETMNEDDQLFGIPTTNLEKVVSKYSQFSAESLRNGIIDEWKQFSANIPQEDDCSLLVIEKL